MERAQNRGSSRKSQRKSQKKEKMASHFSTACFGGYEEEQVICYLWEIVKSIEAELAPDAYGKKELRELEKQIRGRVRVEMRRYFAKQRKRNVKIILGILTVILCMGGMFNHIIGVDRVTGMSMYPYLNHGDLIVYSRTKKEIHRDEVVVFEKDGGNMVKRIAGLPGDTVEINESGSSVVVNGVRVSEDYVTLTDPEKDAGGERVGAPMTVMDDQYLVLGDNRAISIDSRDSNIGTVTKEAVRGRVILIIRAGS